MAIGPLVDVTSFTVDQLYDLYYAVAEKDHAFRLQSLYGEVPPPVGHCVFRPLSREGFTQRVLHYDSLDGGQIGRSLRNRLARQAAAYGVKVSKVTSTKRAA
ncbi:hypothetical protein [Aporhodopirellula aestuarii]|uniref:Uncharacterized protein n=1 Tax=Aporhodopirellula aestuarii TaxID=2950107 RepID=A0ABT0U571_9BACT|nr:hypothetical protein [Aporhodopirellula aestuarii]MCM2371991.1 hypothetical protein [Aporhodopirellula aestuarii]